MDEIICYDEHGYPLEFLTQWDRNQAVLIHGVVLSPTPVVRLSNSISKVSLVVKPTVTDNVLRVDIPNILLTQNFPITVHINYEYGDGASKTRYVFNIPVIPCLQPEDYEMTENIEYVSWVEMSEMAAELMLSLEDERVVIAFGDEEPEETDVFWFDTGTTSIST